MEPTFFALFALLGKGRSTTLVRQEPGVALAAFAASGCEKPVAVVRQVGKFGAIEEVYDGAFGHRNLDIGCGRAMLLLAAAMFAAGGLAVRVIAEAQKRRRVMVGDQPYASAIAAVAAVRAAFRDVCLTSKRHTARATVAALNVDIALIHEVRHDGPQPNGSIYAQKPALDSAGFHKNCV